MPVWNRGAASFASLCPSAQTRHLCGCAALIDENELFGIKIKLAVKPGLPRPPESFAVLLLRRERFFLKVIWRLAKKCQIVAGQADRPRSSRRRSAISARLMSLMVSVRSRINASWASIC